MIPDLRTLGGIFLGAAAVVGAFWGAAKAGHQLALLDAWIELILHLRLQIDCYLMPLDRILASASRDLMRRLGGIGITDPQMLLSRSISSLDAESGRLITSLFASLGSSYRAEELKCCDYHLALLRAHRDRVASALPTRIRMQVTLTLCSALGSLILLW